ncbi:DUF4179 domain-containing protein [Lysinibacillus sp. LZ02]|uniref:DUF4179 domain-containing protein n=1 Tax=Lysinibacillus sp. LZ02 TaxID=3420668 RepID=UPI003D35C5ED
MENNIKKVIEDIEVPLQKLDEAIQNGMQAPKKRRNPLILTALFTTATVGVILGSGFVSPKVANVLADVPLIGFMYEIEKHDEGLSIALSDDNKVVLNETVTSNGVSITLEEIVYDGHRLNVIFSMPTYEEVYPLTVLVDGEMINTGEGLRTLAEGEVYRGLWDIHFEGELPDTFELTIKMHQIGDTKGEWIFTAPVKKVENDSVVLQAGQTGVIDGIPYTVENVVVSTTSTKIDVMFEKWLDELALREGALAVTITDQTGTPLQKLDQRGSGTDDGMVYTYLVEPLEKDVTEIQLRHYFIPFTFREGEEIIEELADTLPQIIPQGEMGDIVITNVEQRETEAILTFHSTSNFSFDDSFIPNRLDIVNEAHESIITEYPKAIGPNEYEMTFQLVPGKIFVQAMPISKIEIEPSAIVTIPVK